ELTLMKIIAILFGKVLEYFGGHIILRLLSTKTAYFMDRIVSIASGGNIGREDSLWLELPAPADVTAWPRSARLWCSLPKYPSCRSLAIRGSAATACHCGGLCEMALLMAAVTNQKCVASFKNYCTFFALTDVLLHQSPNANIYLEIGRI
ncbi:MAG: hypothetical protein MJY92_06665, partial [Bacteroidales bacterium]|nr:hypothetical protein [Bacteroidales bacterium]